MGTTTTTTTTTTTATTPTPVTPTPSPARVCPPGGAEKEKNCYKVFDTKLNWESAEDHCQKEGGHLASIHSKEENNYIYYISKRTKKKKIWIGLSYNNKLGKWAWSDGTSLSFKNHKLTGPKEGCLILYYKGIWKQTDCYVPSLNFVC